MTTTQGFVFLTGGVDSGPNEPVRQQKALRNAYILNFQKRQLVPVAKMLIGRLEHSLAVLNDEIYAIGGYTDFSESTATCEKYSPKDDCWSQLPSLKTPCQDSSVCTFNNRYIYRIGGKAGFDTLLERIDRFDTSTNKWEDITLDLSTISPSSRAYFRILSMSASVQVSHDSILVFGGTHEDYSNKSSSSYVLRLKRNNIFQERPEVHEVVAVNEHELPTAEAFWSQQAIIYDRKIFALQNVPQEGKASSVCLDKKRVLMFDHNKFTVIN